MDREFEFYCETSLGEVYVDACINYRVNWSRRELADYEIEIGRVTDSQGRLVKSLLRPSDHSLIYAKAVTQTERMDLVGESEDYHVEIHAETQRDAV